MNPIMISLMNPIIRIEPFYDFSNEPYYKKWTLLSGMNPFMISLMSPIIRNEPYYDFTNEPNYEFNWFH